MTAPRVVTARPIHVCGWQAVSALFARHPEQILRLFFDETTGKRAGELCRYLARERKVYRQVPADELKKVAGTVHHGGIVAIIAERACQRVRRETIASWAQVRAPLILLDRVGNANNLGAIVRTAAFFGVKILVVPDHPAQALPGDAAWRVAEGGMEFVDFYRVPALPAFCAELRQHFFVIGTSLSGAHVTPSSVASNGSRRPPALVLGNEEDGISSSVAAACDALVRIPGSGSVESLNVAAAAAVLCWEFFGRRA